MQIMQATLILSMSICISCMCVFMKYHLNLDRNKTLVTVAGTLSFMLKITDNTIP